MVRGFAAFVVAWLWCAAAAADGIPLDADGFTRDIQLRIQNALPGATVTIDSPLALTVTPRGKAATHTYLDRIYDYCQRMQGDCEPVVDNFVRVTAKAGQPDPSYDATNLRAVLRLKAYADSARNTSPDKPADFFLARPFAGEMVEMCVIDLPDTALLLNADMFKKLNLDADAAFARCESNVAASETVPDDGQPVAAHIWVAAGDYYYSSLPLLHDAWKKRAARGPLLIVVPDPTGLFFADSDDADTLAALARVAQKGLQMSERPLSAQILRWTPTGWEVVTP